MVLRCCGVAECTQSIEFKTTDRTPVQFALELEVNHIDVDIVVVEFVEDIEIGKVTSADCVRVGSTRGVEGVAVRVDIETTLYFTTNYVDVLAQCTRSCLLTVAVAGEHFETQSLRDVVRCVGIECVTLYVAHLVPSRVVHH